MTSGSKCVYFTRTCLYYLSDFNTSFRKYSLYRTNCFNAKICPKLTQSIQYGILEE